MAGPYESVDALDAALSGESYGRATPSVEDLDALIDQSAADDITRLGVSAKQSLSVKPENFIKARQLGEKVGIPADVAERNLAEIEYRANLDKLEKTLQDAPSLGRLMQDPGYLKRTHDDIDALAKIEFQANGFRAASEFKRKALDEDISAIFSNAVIGAKVDRARPRDALDIVGQAGSALASSLWSANSGLWGLGRMGADVVGTVLPDEAAKEISNWFAGYQKATGKTAEAMLGDAAQQGFVERSVYQGLQSLGQNLMLMPAAMVSGGSLNVALAPMAAITGGAEYGKARDKGVALPNALTYAASQAVIEYATEKLPVGKFLEDLAAGKTFGKMLMGQLASEIPGEQVATLLQDLNEWAVINPGKPFSSYLEERPSAAAQTLIATMVGVGGQVTTVKGLETLVGAVTGKDQAFSDPFVVKSQAAMRALEAERLMGGIIDAAAQSASIARDPSAVQELINETDGDTEVFINARQFANVFNQDPVVAAGNLGVTPAALNDALASNGDLVVPLSGLATAVAQDPALRPIVEHARVDPGDMSPADARLWQSQQGEQFKAEAEQILAQRSADEAYQAEVEAVHQNILGQLNQARRFNAGVNEKYAALVRDFYVTMAERAGMSVTEMAQAYPLRVVAEGTGQLNQNTDQINTPEFENWFGSSQAVRDGTPIRMTHATAWDFTEFDTTDFGAWFAEDPSTSNDYAEKGVGDDDNNAPRSIPVFIKAENPFFIPAEADLSNDISVKDFLKAINKANGSTFTAKDFGLNRDYVGNGFEHVSFNDKFFEILKDEGFDSVQAYEGGKLTWNVFSPTQIKSAIGNRGTFDPNDPNILRQAAKGEEDAGAEYSPADYNALPDDVRAIVDAQIAKTDHPEQLRKLLNEFSGTPWARQAISGAIARQALDDLLAGKDPQFFSVFGAPSVQKVKQDILAKGEAAVWAHLTGSLIGHPEKPVNAVNSSFLNCEPSKACATYCYAATGFNYLVNVVKAEMVAWAIEKDPVRAAKMVAREYKAMPEFEAGKALRMFDKGDGGARWLPFLNALEAEGVRTHIFSKRPDFLRQVSPFHLRLLSVDGTNQELSDNNPDLPVAYVYSGTQEEANWLNANIDKVQLVLPVVMYEKFLTKQQLSLLDKDLNPHICPVDKGVVSLKPTIDVRDKDGNIIKRIPISKKVPLESAQAKAADIAAKKDGKVVPVVTDNWNCARCDKGGGVGCYHGQTTKSVLERIARPLNDLDLEAAVKELKDVAAGLPAEQRASLFAELGTLISRARGGFDARTEAANPATDAGQPGREAAGDGRTRGNAGKKRLKQGERGFFDPTSNTLGLLEAADLSTFLHESGHFFLEVMADMAAYPGAPVQVRQDFEKTLAWFGIQGTPDADPITTWTRMTLDEKRQYHEQFARGFEAYLFEGNAPSVEMQGIFQRFRSWLTAVYKSLTALNVELTDEVRGVFGRMLASEKSIQTAEAVRNLAGMFQTPEQAGMTAEEWAQYQAENEQARANAIDEVQTRSIRDMRWLANAKAKKIKELQATAKAVREQVMMEVRREVMSQPLYRAWHFLTGKPLDKAAKIKKAKSDPNVVDPTKDTLLVAIAKLGGINKLKAVEEWGLDPKEQIPQVAFGKPVVRVSEGRDLDGMAEALAEYGYLPVDEHGKWDLREFEERFFEALRGREIYSSWGDEAQVAAATGTDPDANINLDNTPFGKLDTTWLKEYYGDADTAPWRLLSALKMTSPDGLHPDVVANLFGFTSGDDLVRRLAVAQDPQTVIEGMTDQRMLEQYGDLSSAKDIELAAERAIHNDVRARVLTRELNALRKATGKANVMLQAARQHAEQWIARQKVKDAIKHGQHAAAETRSGKAAMDALAKGDTDGAARHKLDQLLNNQLTRQAIRAGEEVRRALTYLKKFDKDSTRKAIDPAYRDQIDQLLERFDLRQVSQKALDKRASLAAWVAEQEALGLDPVVDQRLVEEAQRQHYSTLTLEEFRGLVDTVKSIEHLGRLKNKLLTAKTRRELAAVVADLEKSIRDNANRDVVTGNAITPLEKGGKILRNFMAMHRKFASIVREMDGGKDGGPLWEILVRSMNEAGDREVKMRGEMSEKFSALFAGLEGIKLNEKIAIPEIGGSLRREELIAVALNAGNEGNVQRLLDGGINEQARAITPQQLMGILNRLTNAEWDFVEGVWAMIEANRPAIAAQEKALTGVEPKWVEPSPFTLASGRVIRGGYYPAKYNGTFSTRSNELEAVTDLKQQMMGAAGRSSTRKSYTEQRAKEVSGRPLNLNLSVIGQHINEVTHRLAWQSWLIDARRVLGAPAIDRAIRDHYGPEILNEMKQQLVDIAAGDNGASNALDQVMNHIRNGTTIAGMGWNIMTSLMQPIGLTQSIERVGAKWIGIGLAQFIQHPFETTAKVNTMSSFMTDRAKTINREINDVLNQIRAERMSKVEASYFYLIQKFQQMVDMPTWLGAYNKALADGNAEDRAIAMADQAVIDSQGGGQMKDLARIQRGPAGQKLFTNFYSFFSTTYNLAAEARRATDFTNPLQVGKLAANYLLLFVLPTVWGFALKEALKGSGDDDPEKILKKLAMEQLNYMLGTMVLVREIGSAVSGFQGYTGPAGTRFFAELGKFVQQAGQGDVDVALVKAAANTVGIAAHLPSGQVIRSVEGTVAVIDGKAGPQAVLVGPPLKH